VLAPEVLDRAVELAEAPAGAAEAEAVVAAVAEVAGAAVAAAPAVSSIQPGATHTMAQFKRKRLLVDPKVQGALVVRVICYWLACMATVEFLALTWSMATGPEQPSFAGYFINYDWPAAGGRMLLASIVLIPISWDMLTFSNRFAGPVYRMRRVLREVARGGAIENIQLREGDFWHGLADDMNAALRRLAPLETAAKRTAGADSATADAEDNFDLADDFFAVK
jgi:hypothetical protein